MKGKLSVLFVFILSAILMSSFIVIAAPDGLSFAYLDSSNESHIAVYTDYDGNLAGDDSNYGVLSKTFYFNDAPSIVPGPTDRYIVITVSGTNLSFTAHNIVLTSLCIKGGDSYRIFTFDPAAISADNLYAPLNGGGEIPTVSHYVLLGFQMPPVVPPTVTPTDEPPTLTPTDVPPTVTPTDVPPTLEPTLEPTATPTDVPPTLEPTLEPTATPTDVPPTLEPTLEPTATPTDVPPTLEPTLEPTATPTDVPPTLEPTLEPTATPTDVPPTNEPTIDPTASPTETPTASPSPTTGVLGATKPPTATPTTTVLGAVKTGEANYQTTMEIAVVLLAAFGTAGFVYVFRRRTSED